MGYNQVAYNTVVEELSRRRTAALSEAEAHRTHLHSISPEAREIDAILSGTAMRVFQAAIGNEDAAAQVDAIRRESEHLLSARRELLLSLGLPADYTEPHYTCPHCQDTGYVLTQMCECMKTLLCTESLRLSGVCADMDAQTFDTFTLDYYKQDADALALMKQNLAIAKAFADNFAPGKENLLLLGGTGLGKTHLSTAIARVVAASGNTVVYETAQSVFDAFEHDRFHSGYGETTKTSERFLTCDLLILDDFGSEFSTSFVTACTYQLINTRLIRGLSTVISTNLTAKELLSRYDERVTSRILGTYRILKFVGNDIRRQKLLEQLS